MAISPISSKFGSLTIYPYRMQSQVNFRGNDDFSNQDFAVTNPENTQSINRARLTFSCLTDEQIDEINRTGQLPENAKFVKTANGEYAICNNFLGVRAGTRQLPEGYEVKKNALGLAIVVPKGTQGLFIQG